MSLQVIHDSKGKATGVFIPMKEWNELKKQYGDLRSLEQTNKDRILIELKEAVNELALIEKGQAKARPSKDLLDEL